MARPLRVERELGSETGAKKGAKISNVLPAPAIFHLPMTFDQSLLAGESQTLDFKTSVNKATLESLIAFANAHGGTVLVGISDPGEVGAKHWATKASQSKRYESIV